MSEPSEWLGVDVGWVYPAVDSDGQIHKWARPSQRRHTNLTAAGPVKITRADGTTTTRNPYTQDQLADIEARSDRQGSFRLRQIANSIVSKAEKTGRGVALEHWDTFNARRTAWTDVYKAILQRAEERGVPVRAVNRAWTSLTCPECGFVDRVNRPDRGTFLCGHCGHTGQADRIAATNMRLRALHHDRIELEREASCANPACQHTQHHRAHQCIRCYFFRRRTGRYPTAEQIARLKLAAEYKQFITLNHVDAYGFDWGKVSSSGAKPRPETGWTPAFARPDRPDNWEDLKARVFWTSALCGICGGVSADDLDFDMIDGDYRIENLKAVCSTHWTPMPAIAWKIRNQRTR